MRDGISARAGRQLAKQGRFAYYDEHHLRKRDRYHRSENPEGYIGLCVSENMLVSNLLLPKMAESRRVPPRVLAYEDWVGAPQFRAATAAFMGRSFLGREIDPGHLYGLAGASAVLEAFFYAVTDPGDCVLIPTPSYAGFWADLEGRDEARIVPVHTSSADGFRLTTEALDAAMSSAPGPVRAMIFTTPDNPLGRVYRPQPIDNVLGWCEDHGIHVVVDEIYALSVFGETPFTSAAALRDRLGDNIHIVWAFSKDFGMSGLRAGVIYTENEEVGRSLSVQAMWSSISNDTQHLLTEMVSDEVWAAGYVSDMQELLRGAYSETTKALGEAGIPYLESEAGFFLLCDMREFLDEQTWEAEHRLWQRFLDDTNVNLTPGSACRINEPGFMRLCFAAEQTATVVDGIRKLATALG